MVSLHRPCARCAHLRPAYIVVHTVSSANFTPDQDEMIEAGLTPLPSVKVLDNAIWTFTYLRRDMFAAFE